MKFFYGFMVLIICTISANSLALEVPSISNDVQVELTPLHSPSPLLANNQTYLVYELTISNLGGIPLRLINLQISGRARAAAEINFNFKDQELKKMTRFVGGASTKENSTLLAPGMSKMILVWLPFTAPFQIPDVLNHSLTFLPEKENALPMTLANQPILVKQTPPTILGAPVGGQSWFAGSAPSNTSIHRSAYRASSGSNFFAQRYAIDFIKLDKEGHSFKGEPNKNSNYYCYNTPVYAVADARVVDVRNDVPENVPTSGKLAIPLKVENAPGNFVGLDIGYDQFAFYGHMIPGSITVKPGDIVKKGQIIGRIGNSGNSSEPHLHFQVNDRPSFLGSNGIPYTFEKFLVQSGQIIQEEPLHVKTLGKPEEQHNQLILENSIVGFPDKPHLDKPNK
jgi:hypothetical protein